MKYNGHNLKEVLKEHKLWLDLCGKRGTRASFEDANLKSANLEGANLEGANFQGANLRSANLESADLRGAYLRGTYLRGANLRGANLRGAYLGGADLEGTDFRDANLESADFEGANLSFTCIKGFYIGNHFTYSHNGRLKIGCIDMPLEDWTSQVREIGGKNSYTEKEITKVENLIHLLIMGDL